MGKVDVDDNDSTANGEAAPSSAAAASGPSKRRGKRRSIVGRTSLGFRKAAAAGGGGGGAAAGGGDGDGDGCGGGDKMVGSKAGPHAPKKYYKFHRSVDLLSCSVVDVAENTGMCMFELRTSTKSFSVITRNAQVCDYRNEQFLHLRLLCIFAVASRVE